MYSFWQAILTQTLQQSPYLISEYENHLYILFLINHVEIWDYYICTMSIKSIEKTQFYVMSGS